MGRPGRNSQGATSDDLHGRVRVRCRDRRAVRLPVGRRHSSGRTGGTSLGVHCPRASRGLGRRRGPRSSLNRFDGSSKVSRSSPRSCIPTVEVSPILRWLPECTGRRALRALATIYPFLLVEQTRTSLHHGGPIHHDPSRDRCRWTGPGLDEKEGRHGRHRRRCDSGRPEAGPAPSVLENGSGRSRCARRVGTAPVR